jgi:hypothetical protein
MSRARLLWGVGLVAVLGGSTGCSEDDPGSAGPGGSGGSGGDVQGGSAGMAPGGGGSGGVPTAFAFAAPLAGASLIDSAAVELSATPDIEAAEVTVAGEASPRCTFDAPPFICLIDLTGLPEGAFTLDAVGSAGGSQVAEASVALERRAEPADVCPDTTAPTDCIAALVAASAAAGYAGLSYHCMDDGHAAYDTSAMPGIEVQVNQAAASQDPWHADPARILVGNQSQAYNFGDGWMSIPRIGTISYLDSFWLASKLFLWPEHRDHGYADFYAWQTPTLIFSQGSSGTELDEVGKLLHILAAFPGAARAAMHDAGFLMPATVFVHRRARVASDLEYLAPPAHPPAFIDADTARAGIRLANAIVAGETPPIARLAVEDAAIPQEWADAGFGQLETSPFALTWSSPALPAAPPAGTFSVTVDLSNSADLNDRPLLYFARVVRGDPAHIRVTQLDAARFRVESEWPLEVAENVAAQSRTSRRATVAFVAHNGLYPSAPSFLSVFGADPHAHAPDANNLD